MYNFYMVEIFGIFKYDGSLYIRTGTNTARNIFTKNAREFRCKIYSGIFDILFDYIENSNDVVDIFKNWIM